MLSERIQKWKKIYQVEIWGFFDQSPLCLKQQERGEELGDVWRGGGVKVCHMWNGKSEKCHFWNVENVRGEEFQRQGGVRWQCAVTDITLPWRWRAPSPWVDTVSEVRTSLQLWIHFSTVFKYAPVFFLLVQVIQEMPSTNLLMVDQYKGTYICFKASAAQALVSTRI